MFVSLSSHAHATALTTLTTGAVAPDERGTILGLEHGLFSLARIVGTPLGATLLSSPPSSSIRGGGDAPSSFAVVSSGTEGLWRVIVACTVMDVALMMCLNAWSERNVQNTKYTESDEEEEESDSGRAHVPLLDTSGGSDKDHSD